MADTTKITVTVDKETEEWLRSTYTDALSDQEAIRMAISDARLIREKRDVFVLEDDISESIKD